MAIAALEKWAAGKKVNEHAKRVVAELLSSEWIEGREDRALKLIKKLGAEGDKEVRRLAIESLRVMTVTGKQTVEKALAKWFKDTSEHVRSFAKEARRQLT